MKLTLSKSRGNLLYGASVAVALMTLCAAASAALPTFNLDPAAVGLNGAAVTADNILISNYSTVTIDPSGTSPKATICPSPVSSWAAMHSRRPG